MLWFLPVCEGRKLTEISAAFFMWSVGGGQDRDLCVHAAQDPVPVYMVEVSVVVTSTQPHAACQI